jgi:hypothetical protein
VDGLFAEMDAAIALTELRERLLMVLGQPPPALDEFRAWFAAASWDVLPDPFTRRVATRVRDALGSYPEAARAHSQDCDGGQDLAEELFAIIVAIDAAAHAAEQACRDERMAVALNCAEGYYDADWLT